MLVGKLVWMKLRAGLRKTRKKTKSESKNAECSARRSRKQGTLKISSTSSVNRMNRSLSLTKAFIILSGSNAFTPIISRISKKTSRLFSTIPSKSDEAMFIDIGANLADQMYQGNYRGKERHDADLDTVLQRAWDNNLNKIIITAGTLEESREALKIARTDKRLFCSAGVHPTRCSQEFGETEESWAKYMDGLRNFVEEGTAEGKIVALGELGLDYARLEFCNVETQKKGLLAQLELAKDFDLPLFLHNRETGKDLLNILKEHYFTDGVERAGGVVHSFDDSLELAEEFMDLGLYIGINGCSLKTEDNLKVVKALPLDKLLLETDCPWCDIRQTHAGSGFVQTKFDTKNEKKYESGCCVKGRYEPCHIAQVCEVIAGVKGISVEEVANATKENALTLFSKMNI